MQPILYLSNPELVVRQCSRRDRRDIRVWKVEGTLVQETAAAIKFIADELVMDCEALCLDLSLVEFVDGAAMSILRRLQCEGVHIVGNDRLSNDGVLSDSAPPDRPDMEDVFGTPGRYFA